MRLSAIVSLAVFCGIAWAVPAAVSPAPRDCSAEVAKFNIARREARGHAKRTFYPSMLNLTCVLSPETPMEDYVSNPPVRVNVKETQVGVDLIMDIGVIDTTTCKPLLNSMVEIWSPNAQGNYGSTFLRGATLTSSNGIAEFQTIFPGYTSDAANHFNILVHPQASETSGVAHVGQLFFTDQWTNIIGMYTGYNQNTNSRMMNAKDPNFAAANKNGFSSIVDIEEIGDDWADPEGVIGYITVGVNPTKRVA
ncbi:Intradiol ring-cleavage dioxygenase [Mycena sp. CBHHK59/15]|nr:Intradiol ring-cleavage dioxygenase [Mycena sp. CBHHK59/15]